MTIESNVNIVKLATTKKILEHFKLGFSRYWIFVNDIIEWNSSTLHAIAEQNITGIKRHKDLSFKALTKNIVKPANA